MSDDLRPYYTVIVPFVSPEFRTEWHADDRAPHAGATLTRGAFRTIDAAIAWGRDHLRGAPYSVKRIDPLRAALSEAIAEFDAHESACKTCAEAPDTCAARAKFAAGARAFLIAEDRA